MSNACLILSAAVLQGAKQVLIGDRLLRYDPARCFIASLELPASERVVEATPARPYVAISLMLDRDALADLLSILPDCPPSQATGFAVMPVTRTLLEAWHQLLTLFDTPDDAAVLAPLREREILYRLLQEPQAAMLRQIARADLPPPLQGGDRDESAPVPQDDPVAGRPAPAGARCGCAACSL